jgi:hypothetical protein
MERERDTLNQSRIESSISVEAFLHHLVGQMDPIQARIPYELHIR